MIDGYQVSQLAELTATSQAFAGQQAVPTELSSTLQGARAIDTGEAGLTGQIQGAVDKLAAALDGLASGLGQDAKGLNQMFESYTSAETTVGDSLGAIQQRLQGR